MIEVDANGDTVWIRLETAYEDEHVMFTREEALELLAKLTEEMRK